MIFLMITIFVLSLVLTACARHYALNQNIMDIPNGRSSHKAPTPRGGGVGFVVAFVVTFPLLRYFGFETQVAIGFVGAGLIVAVVGFLDDKHPMRPSLRLLGHFSAGLLVLYFLGDMPTITIWSWKWYSGYGLNLITLFYLVWMLNLYNFMDGIDGIAGLETVSVCLSGALIYWLHAEYSWMGLPLALAASVAGFLWWNLPPARVFMGDAGSGFLGLMLGVLSIQASTVNIAFFWSWLILLGVFIVDATVTLIVRLFRKQKLSQAHCTHAYQHVAKMLGHHLPVTMGVCLINIGWLLPIAIVVSKSWLDGFTGLILAYLPLIGLAILLKSGRDF